LALMYAENRSEFNQFILGTTPLDTWWANMPADDPRYIGHLVNRIADKSCVVPLWLHGDGVPIGRAKKRTLDVVSFGSMVGKQGCTWDTKLLVFTVLSAAKWSGDHENVGTMALVWKILLWSFGVLMKGNGHHAIGMEFRLKTQTQDVGRRGRPLCAVHTGSHCSNCLQTWIIYVIIFGYNISTTRRHPVLGANATVHRFHGLT
jgi:hypothetical protein